MLEKIKGYFKRTPVELPVREPAAAVLARTELPQRTVTLEDISIYNLPIDFAATKRLALAINVIKETPVEQFEISQLKPPASVSAAIPWAASAIAHHYNPDIPVILPNEEDVIAVKPWLRDISNFLGRFSIRWQQRFGRFIEKKAEVLLDSTTENIFKKVDPIGEIGNPRARFVPELTDLYQATAKPHYRQEEDFFGTPKKVAVPIEQKIANLISSLRDVKYGFKSWINKSTYPLLTRAITISGLPPAGLDENMAGVVGSEIMQGVEEFLKRHGVKKIPQPPVHVKTFDLFDGETWNGDSVMRSLTESFAWEKLIAVRRQLPTILMEVQSILPENGPETLQAVRILAENVLILSKQGVSNAEIAAALFRKSKESK